MDRTRIAGLAERFDLDPGRRYETLSHGNKQKPGLIQAFMHRPELIILDEPTLGLDPLIQREFREVIRESVADGATVFLSSHVLSEVELICDRIGLIRGGLSLFGAYGKPYRELPAAAGLAVLAGVAVARQTPKVPG